MAEMMLKLQIFIYLWPGTLTKSTLNVQCYIVSLHLSDNGLHQLILNARAKSRIAQLGQCPGRPWLGYAAGLDSGL